ncbi:hypothetical protein BKP35_16205 [Anaerobacillus arseniciselenatis]|uniref:Uncharacterized protein n=1 Tax=Anaerobacillus arseniciselenatis TaxID=85682 RepID=A0A1S2LA85_9BACI|nr:hypothetical protein [Anaerobacillus arseniciselenatis]OIJ09399.1 hypothetical protein BKP35_16205 [Anaerobacillus arseniciselenatis]
MYTYIRIAIDNKTVLALVVSETEPKLLNFCTLIRANYIWKNNIFESHPLYTPLELNNLRMKYQQSLVNVIDEQGYALVDISCGEILDPSNISETQKLGKSKGPLPF